MAATKVKAAVLRPTIGWRELVTLPTLKLVGIKAKVDTGARSSSLDADDVKVWKVGRNRHVGFTVHFEVEGHTHSVRCESALVDERWVTSSDGRREFRPVIQTDVRLWQDTWPIEITLTSRADMGFPMLLGRQAMRRRFVVDPGRSFLADRTKKTTVSAPAPKRVTKKSASSATSALKLKSSKASAE